MAGAAPLPLSWAAVEHYAEAMAMDHDSRAILHHVIRGLDDDWQEDWRNRQPKR